MNKSQREYAISRVRVIINEKYNKQLKEPRSIKKAEVLNSQNMKHNGSYEADYCANYILKNHPVFVEYREYNDQVDDYNATIKAKISNELQEATDFIMLGNNKEVMDYISNL